MEEICEDVNTFLQDVSVNMTMNLGITNISTAIEDVIENLYQILPELLAGNKSFRRVKFLNNLVS